MEHYADDSIWIFGEKSTADRHANCERKTQIGMWSEKLEP